MGNSLADIKDFPAAAKREVGYQLDRVQKGLDPIDYKPMPSIGLGVKEIRIHENGEFRVLYVLAVKNKVNVLHAFRKKTQKTPKREIETARRILKQVRS